MSPVSRRIFLYWLLLLVPTLVVGTGAILLLRREQARMERQSAYAQEASRAAVETRARLVGETVELIVGDVQAGLLDALAAEPPTQVDAFLDGWEKSNPLVRTTFRATADGRLVRPDTRAATEEAQGFLRRFARTLNTNPPWGLPTKTAGTTQAKLEKEAAGEASLPRQDAFKNVAQTQSARRDVQELLSSSNRLASNYAPSAEDRASSGGAPAAALPSAAAQRSRGSVSVDVPNPKASKTAPRTGGASAPPVIVAEGSSSLAPAKSALGQSASPGVAPDPLPDRRGWELFPADGKQHALGWVQPAGVAEVRGVEVNLGALIARFAGALPSEIVEGEGYALRDGQGRVVHQAGAVSRETTPIARVPLASTLLPGWEVLGFLITSTQPSGAATGLFGFGVTLVAIFVAAILAGGSLLLWQARRGHEEAAQKTSFVANVSHEFKTPLTTIRLYSELLEQGRVRDQAQSADYLRTIGRETQRLARLVNNALDFSRLDQGRKKYAREGIDLSVEMTRLLDTHSPRLAEAGLVLRRDLPDTAVQITTDRDALEQIVINLLDNACKYASEGGEVGVAIRAGRHGGAEVRVSDRGPGVPPEHREKIFEKFHRVDDALTAEKTGAGLGLSIARQLARGLGGELRYASRPGTGAEFVLQLP